MCKYEQQCTGIVMCSDALTCTCMLGPLAIDGHCVTDLSRLDVVMFFSQIGNF